MHIKKLYINNFRGYRNFTLNTQEKTNILTGVNNSGKTTILEAISLWNEIFNYLIVTAQKRDLNLNLYQGDYRFGKKYNNYLDYRQINSVRSFGYKDVFFNLNTTSAIEISATIELPENEEIEVGFIIKEANGNNYNVSLKNHDQFNFRKFNDSFQSLPNSIGCYFSSPVATVSSYEEFALKPKINEGIKTRQSFLFFRNRLYDLYTGDEFQVFKTKLSQIIYGEPDKIEFNITGDKTRDINIGVEINIKDTGFKNISLLGSGTLQIIEILLHLYEHRKELNLILLDEPDSHIHRDIQKRLLKELKSNDAQIFLTTHNESLIRSANPKSIFFIDETVSSNEETLINPISQTNLPQRKTGISNSYHSKIINNIGSETSLDILNALEADKIIFVEGTDDSEYIQKILAINNCDKECVYWSFGGLDKLISKIKHYKEFFIGLGCNQSIWDKCSIVIDADFMTDIQKTALKDSLRNKLDIPVFVWNSYTIESSLIQNKTVLSRVIENICTQKNVVKTIDEINVAIENSFTTIKGTKINLINTDEVYSKRITGQLQGRVINLKNQLDITTVFQGGDFNLFNHYRLFAVDKLNNNRIDHICNKDDVDSILLAIFSELGISKSEDFENHFSELLNSCTVGNQTQDWLDLIQFIET